ncbi:MAG: efflux transporter outer membrane subunit [Verrucomicrobia bacterium]|nr:efflux transporter outer membrane subunit [Verrucomicrobiota bacterium]
MTPALLILLSACVVGPDYQRPEVEAPVDWRWKVAEPSDHVPRGEWWRVFGDPALDALEAEAMAGNPGLQAAMFRVDQARANARITRADFYPTLDAAGAFTRFRTSGNAPSPVPPFEVPSFQQSSWSTPVDLSYEFDLWGKVRRAFESSRSLAFGAEAARQSILLTLQADVAIAYFSLLSTREQVALLTKTIEIREEALDLIRQRAEVGIGNEFEVQRALVEVESAKAELAGTRQRQAQWHNALAILCGKPPAGFDPRLADALPAAPTVAPDLPSALLERRPDVAEAERQLAARNAQIGVAKAAFFPVVRLTATGGFVSGELSDLFDWESRVWSINPSVSLPVFQGGRNRANLERAWAAYEEGVALYRQQVLVAFGEVEDSLAALAFLDERARARTTAAAAAANAARLSFERYRAGAVNFLEIVDSEQARLANEVARVLIENERLLASVRLIKALGGGWKEHTE